MPNRLANENSPYLLQHANNPVDWYPWGPEALEKARREDKPIFLSIGYAACHWCHVMAHESFEDTDTAVLMNEHFVNIKVDREERPDLDGIYMQAVTAMTGQGGWPMSVFLTPEGQPFYGGTYFPPVRRYNMPAFREVLQAIAAAWRADRASLLENAHKLTDHLRQSAVTPVNAAPLDPQTLDLAAAALAQSYDWKDGGWGNAPKFPQPMAIEFLLRKATRGDSFARDIAAHALKTMAKGGMYDVAGGGFARYSTDDRWLVPHFEKMLYDNAQLALAYLHGWLVTQEAKFRQVCEETLDFVVREMTHPEGGFFSSLDADSEGREGKFYVWTLGEIQAALGDPQDVAFLTAAYRLTATGNFEGKNILQRALEDDQLAEKFGLPVGDVPARMRALHARLLAARSQRIRPATDDKCITAWNALMLAAFAEAARCLDRPDYLATAQRNAHFLLGNLVQDGRLLRSWRDGKARHNAYLEDYAALIIALLSLYQSDPNPRWYTAAANLAEEMIAHFPDSSGGFFDTRDNHEALLTRPKDLQDNATPSGSALAALALLQIAALTGEGRYRDLAEAAIGPIQPTAGRFPTAFSFWLCALDFAIGPVKEVAILGDQDSTLAGVLWETYRPRMVTARSQFPPSPGCPPLLEGRPLINGQPTAYVCQNFVCRLPVNSPADLRAQLE